MENIILFIMITLAIIVFVLVCWAILIAFKMLLAIGDLLEEIDEAHRKMRGDK